MLGGGFGGLRSALGAVRKLEEEGVGRDRVEVCLVERNAFHNIRVRNYEEDLDSVIVPLDKVLGPVGIEHISADVVDIKPYQYGVIMRRLVNEGPPEVLGTLPGAC